MAWYAFERIGDALDLTRDRLWPFDRGTWLRFAVVMFFIGGAGGGFNGPTQLFNAGGGPSDVDPSPPGGPGPTPPGAPPIDAGNALLIVGAVVLAILALVLLLSAISAVMEFVFVESLRSEQIRIRQYFRRYFRRGMRLFAFRIIFNLFGLIVFVAPFVLLVLAGVTLGGAGALVGVLGLIVLAPIGLALFLAFGLISGFTTNFVVPIMLLEDVGIIAGWQRLWPTVRAEWKQYALYVVVNFFLGLGAGLVGIVLTLVAAVVLAIPFGLLALLFGYLAFAIEGTASIVGIAGLVIVAVLFGLTVLLASLLIQTPIQSYLRYFVLLVLGDTNEEFDVIPDRRPSID